MRGPKQRPVKLAIVRPTMGQGGADRMTLNLLRGLDPEGFEVSLILGRAEGAFLDDVPSHVTVRSLDARYVSTAFLSLSRSLREVNPEIVFSTSSGTNVLVIMARAITRRPFQVILSERNVLYHGGRTIKRRVLVGMKRLLYGKADRITAVSQGVKDDLVRLLRMPPERIHVVYNPVVTPDLPTLMEEEVEHPWFQGTEPVILAAGRLVREKGFDTLIDAFALVRQRHAAHLVILGEGPLEKRLRSKVGHKKLEHHVWFAGFDKNPFRYMARCSIFVLASRDEGLPGVLVQAMACGSAVVSTNCHAGPSEIITQGVDGWLVPVDDPAALAERIEFYLMNPQARREMGERARETTSRFTVDAILPNYVNALIGTTSERMRKWNAQWV